VGAAAGGVEAWERGAAVGTGTAVTAVRSGICSAGDAGALAARAGLAFGPGADVGADWAVDADVEAAATLATLRSAGSR
jgi:hypothetical protein